MYLVITRRVYATCLCDVYRRVAAVEMRRLVTCNEITDLRIELCFLHKRTAIIALLLPSNAQEHLPFVSLSV